MDTDGSNVQRLTFNQAWDSHPYLVTTKFSMLGKERHRRRQNV